MANSDPLIGVVPPGGSGIGFANTWERSRYLGDERNGSFLPLFVYDSEHAYLQSYRAGLKLERDGWRTELFVKRRMEGFPSDKVPTSMAGLGKRSIGDDVGVAGSLKLGQGTAYAELLRDAGANSEGTELRLGYRYEGWWSGRLRLRPYATLAWRDARLNNYYYGVPAYQPGAGVDLELGAVATYPMTEGWQLLGGVGLIQASSAVRGSPVVDDRALPSVTLGLMYGFNRRPADLEGRKPLIVRLYRGASSDCDLLPIISLQCASTHTQDPTDVTSIEVGRKLIEHANGWPVDIAGFVGLLRHQEKGLQPDFWQLNAYYKAYFYGFPWDSTVRTRLGFGAGLSYAGRIPFSEQRDQAVRGRDTSKLLLYLDPTLDINVGDIVRSRSLRDTYVGLGASHRSGVFGWSRVFNNVNGGSNYIYFYLETAI